MDRMKNVNVDSLKVAMAALNDSLPRGLAARIAERLEMDRQHLDYYLGGNFRTYSNNIDRVLDAAEAELREYKINGRNADRQVKRCMKIIENGRK